MPRSSRKFKISAAAAGLAALLLAYATGLFSFAAETFSRAVAAAAAPLRAAGVNLRDAVSEAGADEANRTLEAVIRELRIQNAELKALAVENEALKAALDYRDQNGEAGILARVIASSGKGASSTLVLDRGSADGIGVGLPVTVGKGIMVGKISLVRETTAEVALLSDGRSTLAVTVQNAAETLGVLEGERGLSTKLTMIPPSQRLAPGDTVITSGLEPGIKRGLIVGSIEKIVKNSQDPFQSASVNAFYTSEKLLYLTVHSLGPVSGTR